MREREIRDFVQKHIAWIEKQQNRHRREAEARKGICPLTTEEREALTEAARIDLQKRVQCYAGQIGVAYGRITVRNQKTKWGSCSSRGNLNFNFLLMLAPEYVRDYVVVHELCHRKQMNHSPAFWAEVAKALPDYETGRRWLREHGAELMLRRPTTER